MVKSIGASRPSGSVGLAVTRAPVGVLTAEVVRRITAPRIGLPDEVNDFRVGNRENIDRGLVVVEEAQELHLPVFYGALALVRRDAEGGVTDFGLVSLRVVTTAGVNYLVDAFQGSVEPELFRFHGLGIGTNVEAIGDTALQTEITTAYDNGGNVRATGTLGEGATANVFRTVATNTVDAAVANTEHGIFTQAATGGGTLLDRSKYDVVNLGIGDQLTSTYDLTFTPGG